jgi:hypothetical protein
MDEHILNLPVYGLPQHEKDRLLNQELHRLVQHHATHCSAYRQLLQAYGHHPDQPHNGDIPFLATRLFKTHELKSVPDEAVFKTLTSSGTGGNPSRIYLDRYTASLQSKALIKIMQQWLGKERLPMLIADHDGLTNNPHQFSARAAGFQGMSFLGRNLCHALKPDNTPALDRLKAFSNAHGKDPLLIFGFTYMIWADLIPALEALNLRFPNAILIHGGGWKKLEQQAVGNQAFKQRLAALGIERVHNYYGLVEQTGSIFVECEYGHLHAPLFSDVMVRDVTHDRLLSKGEIGVLQLSSMLPHSYPGHQLLTEDVGRWLGEDDCPCGRLGRYFEVHGRIPKAERRGCSDAY